jgi:hypothetical protein
MTMRTQPKVFLVLGMALIGVALAYPIQIMEIYDHGVFEIDSVAGKLAPLNWAVIIGCLVVALAAFRASPLTLISFPMLTMLVAWNNWVVGQVGTDYTAVATSFATLGFASLGGLLFNTQAWEVIMHPERRWWQRPERVAVDAPVFVIPPQGEPFRAQTFDVSASGAFIRLANDEVPGMVREGDKISLRLTMGALTVLRCEAKVIRCTEARGHYPSGLGVEFTNLNRHESKELRKFLHSMEH